MSIPGGVAGFGGDSAGVLPEGHEVGGAVGGGPVVGRSRSLWVAVRCPIRAPGGTELEASGRRADGGATVAAGVGVALQPVENQGEQPGGNGEKKWCAIEGSNL